MLVAAVQNKFVNETGSSVNEKKLSEDWLKFTSWKAHCTKNTYCVKARIGLSDFACMIINWVRISCSCLKIIFNNNLKLTWWQLIKRLFWFSFFWITSCVDSINNDWVSSI